MADEPLHNDPISLLWRMLPPEARKSYGSIPAFIAEMSPGAAIRDTLDESGKLTRSLLEGRGWDAAGAGAGLLTAMAGVVPGTRTAAKVSKEVAPAIVKATEPFRAYHGSPHDFDRFDLSKIGTGEGAQAYGHGLYFADNPGVAEFYKQSLALTSKTEAERLAAVYLDTYGDHALDSIKRDAMSRHADPNTYAPSIKLLETGWRPQPGKMYEVNIHADPARFLDWDKPLAQQSPQVGNALAEFGPQAGRSINYGNMRDTYYKPMSDIMAGTDIGRLVRPDDFFEPGRVDLAAVRAHLANDPARLAQMDALLGKYQAATAPTGQHAYENIAKTYGEEGLTGRSLDASERLLEAGIPGIRYLDQGSRGFQVHNTYKGDPYGNPLSFPTKQQADAYAAEQVAKGFGSNVVQDGSRNTVVFDPKIIEIMRKYGLLPVAAGGAAAATVPGLLDQQPAETY